MCKIEKSSVLGQNEKVNSPGTNPGGGFCFCLCIKKQITTTSIKQLYHYLAPLIYIIFSLKLLALPDRGVRVHNTPKTAQSVTEQEV